MSDLEPEGFDPFGEFDADALRAHVERVHLMEQLTQHPGWPILVDAVIHDTTSRQNRLILGQVEDFAAYKQMAGWIEGALHVTKVPAKQLKGLADARARLEEHERANAQEADA